MKKLSIIIINYNGWDDTKKCLESLAIVHSSKAEISVVLVDNASTSKIKDQKSSIKIPKLQIDYIQNKENLGFAGGNNVGIKKALENGTDYIMLLNNDTTVDQYFVDPLIGWMEANKKSVVGPKIYFEKGYEYHADRYTDSDKGNVIWYAGGIIDWNNVYASHRGVDEVDIGRYNKPSRTQFVSGCCMAFSADLVCEIGYLDDRYFMYLEDVDFCMRAKNAGYKLWYIPESHVYHKNAQSSGKSGSDLHVYYQTRNRLYFGMKYARLRTKLALLKNSIHVIRNNPKRSKAVLDFYLLKMGRAKNI